MEQFGTVGESADRDPPLLDARLVDDDQAEFGADRRAAERAETLARDVPGGCGGDIPYTGRRGRGVVVEQQAR